MMTKQTKFVSAIVLQVIIIVVIIFFKMSVLTSGTEILLRISPVDPRDLLRGDYITFRYDISTVDKYLLQEEINIPSHNTPTLEGNSFPNEMIIVRNFKNGDTVYVVLKQRDKYYSVDKVEKNKPADGSLFIKGVITSGGLDAGSNTLLDSSVSSLNIIYGIEDYYIPEGKGANFSFFGKNITASVAVDDDGKAVLRKIYVDDKEWP